MLRVVAAVALCFLYFGTVIESLYLCSFNHTHLNPVVGPMYDCLIVLSCFIVKCVTPLNKIITPVGPH